MICLICTPKPEGHRLEGKPTRGKLLDFLYTRHSISRFYKCLKAAPWFKLSYLNIQSGKFNGSMVIPKNGCSPN